MKHNIEIALTLCFNSKWHTGSGEGSLLIDRLVKRDARNWPYVPGSTFKGVVRESCEKLSATLEFPAASDPHQNNLTIQDNFHPLRKLASPVDRIFGNTYESGQLFFRDARLEKKPPYGAFLDQSRVCMYRLLGTAKDQHLFSSEYTAPLGLKTKISGYHEHLQQLEDSDPPFAYCLLVAGIMNVARLGGDKSTGCGELEIQFDSVHYNSEPLDLDSIFDYLDAELYIMARDEA